MAEPPPSLRAAHVALLSAMFAGAVAAPAIHNGYVEDAHWIIEQRPLLEHPPTARALLLEPYWPRTFGGGVWRPAAPKVRDRKSTRLNSSHLVISYAVFCLKKKKNNRID